MENNKHHLMAEFEKELKAHNLSIIIPGGERGKKYKEWQSD